MPDYLGDDQRKVNKDTEDEEKITCECLLFPLFSMATETILFFSPCSFGRRRHSDTESICKWTALHGISKGISASMVLWWHREPC